MNTDLTKLRVVVEPEIWKASVTFDGWRFWAASAATPTRAVDRAVERYEGRAVGSTYPPAICRRLAAACYTPDPEGG